MMKRWVPLLAMLAIDLFVICEQTSVAPMPGWLYVYLAAWTALVACKPAWLWRPCEAFWLWWADRVERAANTIVRLGKAPSGRKGENTQWEPSVE